jgi:formylglycine-generating enzyme required for sulfatase activity
MQQKEKFHEIFDKIRETFEILRGMLPGTPSDPNAVSRVQSAQVIPNSEPNQISQAFQAYLDKLIAAREFVRLPGFHLDNQLLQISLEKAFAPFSFLDKRIGVVHPERDNSFYGGAGVLSLPSALHRYRRLVITGNAGSGKTSLLVCLLLVYARSLREQYSEASSSQANQDFNRGISSNRQRFQPVEHDYLPVLLSLRDLAHFLQEKYRRSVKNDPARLLSYLRTYPLGPFGLKGSALSLPENFFELHLNSGKALILLDGLDEIESPALRQRVVRLIEKFVKRYPDCRYIVTTRPLDCASAALFGELFGTLHINEFSPLAARQFARAWSVTLEKSLAGAETPATLALAKLRADELINALDTNQRLAELAISPLTLTLLAILQRSGKPWPERRADLYEDVLHVLLDGGVHNQAGTEERRALERIAFWLQQHNQCEISHADLLTVLQPWILRMRSVDTSMADWTTETFLQFIVDHSNGLFVEVDPGICAKRPVGGAELSECVYRFAQRTFQEALAAQALADREDTLAYTLKCLVSPWWRNVILFESGILGRQAKHRVSELIRFVMDDGQQSGLLPYHSTFLAAECLFDLDPKHLEIGLLIDVKNSLRQLAGAPIQEGDHQGLIDKIFASNALVSLQGGQSPARFWKLKYGEPEWVKIPAGEFWMGDPNQDGDNFAHRVFLPEYQISRAPVTNAQYALYLKDSGAQPPSDWHNGQLPRGRENHPVVNGTWHDALAYCAWLGQKINRPVSLPSEAEWEKAARGFQDQREYPWGDWDELRANTCELALGDTTPVGLFPNGASPFGLLDMTGNVREWTRSLFSFGYPYDPTDQAREDLLAPDDQPRVLRGGSFYCAREFARCAHRQRYYPDFGFYNFGFRVVISPAFH